MAERGGKRTPSGPPRVGGVGKFAKREDAGQPVVTPPLDHPEIQSGQVQQLRNAARAVPLPVKKDLTPPATRTAPTLSQMRSASTDVPSWVADVPSTRATEDVGTGNREGPGPGPEALTLPNPDDEVELLLSRMIDWYQDSDAYELLAEIQAPPPMAPGMPAPETLLDAPVAGETTDEATLDAGTEAGAIATATGPSESSSEATSE